MTEHIMDEQLRLTIEEIRKKNFDLKKTEEQIFYDLCFCLMAPQTKFVQNRVAIKNLIDNKFYTNSIPEEKLHDLIRKARFFRIKSQRLLEAKTNFQNIINNINSSKTDIEKRDWLYDNINGMGMKAASHFLRNIGYKSFAIIDTHIIKYMKVCKPTNKFEYLVLEKEFIKISDSFGVSPAELDMAIWKQYSNTPWEEFIF